MERKSEIKILAFILVVVGIFLIVSLRLDFFQNLIQAMVGRFGYYAVAVFSFALDLFEQPFGPEVPAVLAVLFGLDVLVVFLVTIVFNSLGAFVSFYVGKSFLSGKVLNSCSTSRYGRHCKMFKKYGKLSLFLAATTPVPFVFFCWISGAFHMKIRDFVLYGLLPRALRVGIVLLFVAVVF